MRIEEGKTCPESAVFISRSTSLSLASWCRCREMVREDWLWLMDPSNPGG